MKLAYNRMYNMCANNSSEAWWCSSPGTFTIKDFIIIIMSSELSPFGEVIVDPSTGETMADNPELQKKLADAAALWFSTSCVHHVGCQGPTDNAIFNWLGENFESAQYLFTANPTPHPNMSGLATAIANAVLAVSENPQEAGTWDLVYWGNESMFPRPPLAIYMILGGDNPAYLVPYGEMQRLGMQ